MSQASSLWGIEKGLGLGWVAVAHQGVPVLVNAVVNGRLRRRGPPLFPNCG